MSGEVLFDIGRPLEFDAVAELTLNLLGLKDREKRYSDNYDGGTYVVTKALGLEIKFYFADDADFPDFPYMLSFMPLQRAWAEDIHKLDDLCDIVARCLASHGMRVARPLGLKAGSPAVFYDGTSVWRKED